MGNPLGPTLANIFLCYYEKLWLQNCPQDFSPVLYKRYIDDTFVLFNNSNDAGLFLNYLNSQHQNIKFTSELETNSSINFLDIKISKENNKFNTSIYRKDSFTGLGIKFNSFIPRNYKINVIKCLVNRAFRICSNITFFDSEIKFLKQFFINNKFPLHVINNIFRITLQHIYNPKPLETTVPRKQLYFNLPYLGNQSNIIKRKLKELVRKFYPQLNLIVHFKTTNTIKNYFPYKDKIPSSIVSNVIYKYQCRECSASYIGETQKQLKVRVSQHKGISFRNPSTILSTQENSSILNHNLETNHEILTENFEILSKSTKFDLRILESIFIHDLKPTLNNLTSSFNLAILK